MCLSFSRPGDISAKTQFSGPKGILWNDAVNVIALTVLKPKSKVLNNF